MLLELDLDVGVLRADHAGVVVSEIDARNRHADIVSDGLDLAGRDELADCLLHIGELIGAFLDARADLRADMHQDRSGIDRRKEITTKKRHQQERRSNHREEADHENRTSPERHLQQVAIPGTKPFETRFETALEIYQRIARARRRTIVMDVLVQEIFRHRRHQRTRQDERPQHGEHHRFRHRYEQKTRDALQEEHRHEDDTDAQQRHESRRHDLVGTVEDGGLDLLALLQMEIDILDRHRCVIDKNADGERKTAQRHDVQRLADHRQHDDRAEHRQRNRYCDDDGGTPASQKQQDHDAGEQRRDDAFDRDAGNRAPHEDGLIADEADL